jgi:hypothetical protein
VCVREQSDEETVVNKVKETETTYNEKLHHLYFSPKVVMTIKLRRMRHVACTREMSNAYKIWKKNLKVREQLGEKIVV